MIYARGCLQRAATTATTVQAMTASSQVHRGEAASNFSVTLALVVVPLFLLLLVLVLVAYCRSHGKYRRSPKRKSLAKSL